MYSCEKSVPDRSGTEGAVGMAQIMHTLLPGGLWLHKDAPRMFSEQLLAQGTLPMMKVNMDAAATTKRFLVRAPAYSKFRA